MKFSAQKRATFLDALEAGSTVKEAAALVGMSERGVYKARQQDKAFHQAWIDAADIGSQIKLGVIEAEMDRRAIEGALRPVYYKGKPCGAVRDYSDTLLIFRAKALAPERYRERAETKRSVQVALPQVESLQDRPKITAALLTATTAGDMTPGEAAELSRVVETHRRTVELVDLDERVRQLEDQSRTSKR
jgi:hypothetical protein